MLFQFHTAAWFVVPGIPPGEIDVHCSIGVAQPAYLPYVLQTSPSTCPDMHFSTYSQVIKAVQRKELNQWPWDIPLICVIEELMLGAEAENP